MGQEPLTVINQMLTLTAILGNSCNAVGQRMGEVILMNVFSNLKEWIDRTAEACEQAKKLKEEKLTSSLFDSEKFTKNLENIYVELINTLIKKSPDKIALKRN